MITYEAMMGEISMMEAARDSLPRGAHVGALFDLAISRLSEQADAVLRAQHGDSASDRLGRHLPNESDEHLRLAS